MIPLALGPATSSWKREHLVLAELEDQLVDPVDDPAPAPHQGGDLAIVDELAERLDVVAERLAHLLDGQAADPLDEPAREHLDPAEVALVALLALAVLGEREGVVHEVED